MLIELHDSKHLFSLSLSVCEIANNKQIQFQRVVLFTMLSGGDMNSSTLKNDVDSLQIVFVFVCVCAYMSVYTINCVVVATRKNEGEKGGVQTDRVHMLACVICVYKCQRIINAIHTKFEHAITHC